MKKAFTILFALLFAMPMFAQVPGRMSYQAVIRDNNNALIINSEIGLRISIIQNDQVLYEEIQFPATNDNGLISIEFGSGESFAYINWAEGPYFIKTEIDPTGGENYTITGTTQMLTVPFAMHALSATYLTGDGGSRSDPGVASQNWSLFGNLNSDPSKDKLGTTDAKDLVLVTNNIERMRILADGNINMKGSLDVDGNLVVDGSTEMNSNLTVDGATDLNGTLNVDGATDLNSALKVNNASPTTLTGSLNVNGATDLDNTLNVDGATNLKSTLDVDGATDLNSTLNVDGATTLKSTLGVDGATDLNNNLNVDGETDLNKALRVNNASATTLTGTLSVDGAADLNNTLNVDGATGLKSTLDVDGAADLNYTLNVDGATTLKSTLEVDGIADLNNNLNVDGETDLNSALRVNNESPTSLTGSLVVDGATDLNNTLNVDGSMDLNNTLTVDGAVDFHSTLNVDGETDLNSALRVNNLSPVTLTGALGVDGITDLNNALNVNNLSPVTLTGTLGVNGATDLNNTLNVDGETDLNSALRVNNLSPVSLTGILGVDGAVDLNSTLNVDGETDLNDALNVNNESPTILTGTLQVDGAADLNNNLIVDGTLGVGGATSLHALTVTENSPTVLTGSLSVDGATDLNGALNLDGAVDINTTLNVDGATNLNSTLSVDGVADLNNSLTVDGSTTINNTTGLNGQVTINANLGGGESSYGAYPLRVQGSGQGIAVKLTAGTPNNSNNFMTFFNSSGSPVGRIEGETEAEKASAPEFIFEESILIAEEVAAGVNTGLALIPIVVGGLGVSAGPCSPCIAITIADLVLATANLVAFNAFSLTNLGVTYQSGSADYAEWLERVDPGERMIPGDIVGVYSGKISKYTVNAPKYLVISTKPAMLGNMPDPGQEYLYEKVAFMGQIPVRVRGLVLSGDYILPSGLNDGTGIAVSRENITAEQYREIIGVAWSNSLNHNGVSLINMAIGLNANDVADLSVQHERKIQILENQFKSLEERLVALETGTGYSPKAETPTVQQPEKQIQVQEMTRAEMIERFVPAELTDEMMQEAMVYLENGFREKGVNINDHPGLNKLFNDPAYRAEILKKTQDNYRISYQRSLEAVK